LIVGSGLRVRLVAILFVWTAMSWRAALLPRFMDTLAATERGTGFGLIRTSYMIVSATGSTIVGAVADIASWNVAFGAVLNSYYAAMNV
jgi:hypothetical protein